MGQPVLTLRDTNDAEITIFDFGQIASGGVSSEIEVRVWNDYGGVNDSITANNVSLRVLNENGEEQGDLVEQCWLECKVGSPNDTATPLIVEDNYSPIGKGHYPNLGTIQKDTFRTVFLRVRVPPGASTSTISLIVSPFRGVPAISIDPVLYELSEDGVLSEEGNAEFEVKEGLSISVSVPDTVVISEGKFYYKGVLNLSPGASIQLNQNDVNGDPLTEEYSVYGAVISLAPDGTVNATKGVRSAPPATFPECPEGELQIARVTVRYGQDINESDVIWDVVPTEFSLYKLSETSYLIGAGRCVVSQRFFSVSSASQFEVQEGWTVFGIDASGVVGPTGEDVEHLPLWAVSLSGGVSQYYDLRHYVGQRGFWKQASEEILKGSAVVLSSLSEVSLATSDVHGIAEFYTQADDVLFVVTKGIIQARVEGPCNVGDFLKVSATPGVLTVDSVNVTPIVALESITSGTKTIYVLLK